MCIANEFRRRRCEYCRGKTDVYMGINLAPKCRRLLLVRTADMCNAHVRVRSVGVDVSFAGGILIFTRINLTPKCRRLLLVRIADMCIAHVRMSSVGVDVLSTKVAPTFISPHR